MNSVVFLLLIPAVLASICPMEKHQVCNDASSAFGCTCNVIQEEEHPVPLVSCNMLIVRDLETLNFPVVSVEFNLDSSADSLEEWPESEFRDKISSSLRVPENDIIVLRASCGGTDDKLTVQFVILKKDANHTDLPFEIEDFIDADSITTRMKAMGHLSQIANLDVDTIEYTEEMIDLEFDPSNLELIFKATLTGIIFSVFFVMGIVKLFKKEEEYTDDLQKP